MTTHLTEGDCTRSLSGATSVEPDRHLLPSESFSFSATPGDHYSDVESLLRNALRPNCDAVSGLAIPRTSNLHSVSNEFTGRIAAELEARLANTAQCKVLSGAFRCFSYTSDPLDVWAEDVLEWTGFSVTETSVGGHNRYDGHHSDDSELMAMDADYAVPFFKSFLLFVAHYVKEYLGENGSNGLKLKDCGLILPVSNNNVDSESTDFPSTGYVNTVEFALVECGRFPLDSTVERQAASVPHLIVADAVIARNKDDHDEAELRLATKTMELFFSQHNCRFAWGLAATSRTIRAYVFGTDDIWASTKMDITTAEGRQAFISLLVDWSLCPVERLGFDPTIRYVLDGSAGSPYLAIDVLEASKSTGQEEQRTYYSKQCVGGADRLTGRRARYFAASADLEALDTPAFLIKDVWTTLNSDVREMTFLDALHGEFDDSSEFGNSFSHFVSAGPVYLRQGNEVIADSTDTAFAGLPGVTQGATRVTSGATRSSASKVRQHRRTVAKWAGNIISMAADPNQIVVAIADAMVALNAAYVKRKIIHGNITDQAIQFQKTADGVKGVLAEFDYASYTGNSSDSTNAEMPEQIMFQSIRTLERQIPPEKPSLFDKKHANGQNTRLDDWENILYIICVLGTFGINQTERKAYPKGKPRVPPIKLWSSDEAQTPSTQKRFHMNTEDTFGENVALRIRNRTLRRLAVDIHRILFLDPRCPGTNRVRGQPDPLALRDGLEAEIVAELLRLLVQYKRDALAALSATGSTTTDNTDPSSSSSKKRKWDAMAETLSRKK
ncbi:hypothetical protein H4S07_000530 [Coemansia furcata]|uniref:Uncharacterized protein n=1 Tax=Coemansia furcata TaxID=417177 RepID=A0ACC1LR64_9FUNG|nr:hypothetical protein H4S07_000530 [Coemansia furcata]